MIQLLIKLENIEDNVTNEEITQVPSNITSSQLKSLYNLNNACFLYVNGNMIVNTLEECLKNNLDAESVKVIKVTNEKSSAPASYCSSVVSGHNGSVLKCLLFNKNTLVTAGADKTVRFWDCLTKTQFEVHQIHSHWVMVLCELDDYIISGGMDSIIGIFNKEGKHIKNISKQKKGIVKLIKYENNKFIAGARDGSVVGYEIENGDAHILFKYQHKDAVSDIAIYGNILCSASIKGIVKVFEFINRDVKYLCDLNDNSIRVNCIAINKDVIITGDDLGNVTAYDRNNKLKVKYRLKHKREMMCICIDPNNINFITGSFDKTVKGWNLITGECLFTIYHVQEVYTAKYLNDLVISAGKDKLIKTYRPSTREHLNPFVAGDEIYDIATDGKGKVVGIGKDSNVYFYN